MLNMRKQDVMIVLCSVTLALGELVFALEVNRGKDLQAKFSSSSTAPGLVRTPILSTQEMSLLIGGVDCDDQCEVDSDTCSDANDTVCIGCLWPFMTCGTRYDYTDAIIVNCKASTTGPGCGSKRNVACYAEIPCLPSVIYFYKCNNPFWGCALGLSICTECPEGVGGYHFVDSWCAH